MPRARETAVAVRKGNGHARTPAVAPPPSDEVLAAHAAALAAPPPAAPAPIGAGSVPTDFTGAIYDAITKVYASRNPRQLFCLCWPGTVLDYDRLAWTRLEEVGGNMPEDSLVRSSLLLDQYVPAAPITQPDGTRVSDRYAAALSMYGPRPNLELLQLQDMIRSRLRLEITREIDGQRRTFTIAAWFDYLHSQWAEAKRVWADKQLEMREYFKQRYADDPNRDAWWSAYLEWYGDNAEAYVSTINGKWQQLVAEFPLTEWEDAIAILDTHDNAGIVEARQILQNATRPLPYQEGVDFVPTQGIPYDWPLELHPVTKFIDLLADPEAQQMALETALAQLEQEVFNWTAIIPQIDDDQVKADAAALSKATQAYGKAQSDLIRQYTRNTVDAVKMYCDVQKSRGKTVSGTTDPAEQTKITNDVNATATDNAKGSGQSPPAAVDWDQIKDIAEKLYEGQSALIDKQQSLIDAGLALAEAAETFLKDKWNQSAFPWLQGYIQQLRTKLEAVQKQAANSGSSSNQWYKYRSTAPDDGSDPNANPDFGADSFPSPLDGPGNDRWTAVTVSIDTSQLSASNSMSTSFSSLQWGVNLFFGSAGGSYQTSASHFVSEFMKASTKVQIGFLATKVLIDRPWMRPELFAHTRNFFRTTDKPLSPNWQVTSDEMMGPGGGELVRQLMDDYAFPCYPVGFLLVKDVTVRIQIQEDRMSDMRDYAKSSKSQGGGFLCFSVSASESSESQSESTNEYCMAGQFVAKAPAPQIIGYWNQFMPPDESQVLSPDIASEIAQALGFARKLSDVQGGSTTVATPVRP